MGRHQSRGVSLRAGHAYLVKVGQDVSFADLRNHPALLLGGFSLQWRMEFVRELRFQMVRDSDDERIVDVQQKGRVWGPAATMSEDGRRSIMALWRGSSTRGAARLCSSRREYESVSCSRKAP